LLVEKGIITREEVNQKRDYVGRQSVYKNSLDAIYEMQQRNNQNIIFNEILKKVINNTASDEERDYILRELDNFAKNQTKK